MPEGSLSPGARRGSRGPASEVRRCNNVGETFTIMVEGFMRLPSANRRSADLFAEATLWVRMKHIPVTVQHEDKEFTFKGT